MELFYFLFKGQNLKSTFIYLKIKQIKTIKLKRNVLIYVLCFIFYMFYIF